MSVGTSTTKGKGTTGSFNNDSKQSYGVWPGKDGLWGDPQIFNNPDPYDDRIGQSTSETVCHTTTHQEDEPLKKWINENFSKNDPSKNPPCILGPSDCRSFPDLLLKEFDEMRNVPTIDHWEVLGG